MSNVLYHFNLCWGWSCIARISWSTAYIVLVLCSPRHSVSPLWFRHSSRLIQIRTLAALYRHSPSCTCWRDAGIGTRICELDIGWSPPAECTKWDINVTEFKAEIPVDVLHSIFQWERFSSLGSSFKVTHCCFLISSEIPLPTSYLPWFGYCLPRVSPFLLVMAAIRHCWDIWFANARSRVYVRYHHTYQRHNK